MARESQADRENRLLAAIDAAAENSYGSDTDSELADSRQKALQRYLGRNLDPAPEGRSQIRDRTTYETVEWIKPSLLRIFCGNDEVLKFDPQGPEDEQQAQQESDYTNYVLTQRNPWHQICHDWFTDALVLKNGYAYAYWDTTRQVESERYERLSDDAFALIANDPEIEVVAHSQAPDEETNRRNAAMYEQQVMQYQQQAMMAMGQGQMPPPEPQPPEPAFLHEIEIRRTNEQGHVCIETLAPERCRIDVNTKNYTLDGCNYFEAWEYKTLGQLRAEGFDVDDDLSDNSQDDDAFGTEEHARNLYSETLTRQFDERPDDPSMRQVMARRIWIRYDYDGDGIGEMQYVVRVGNTILFREECSEIPVASISPIPMPHRHIGMSVADTVSDIEDVNTAFTRQAIDNLFYSNNPRLAVSDRVNMGDLLDSRPGGVIRVDGQPPQEIMPVVVPDMFPAAVQALQFFDSRRMNRTGINAYFQGTDANVLNKTASGISQLTSSAAQRVELIARLFSFGVARLASIVHRLILQHGHKSQVVMLRNKWVTVNPSEWKRRTDLRIVVGLGTGSKDGQIAALSNIFAAQMQTLPLGVSRPENIYHTLIEMAKAASFSNAQAFFTDPTVNPPPQAPQDPSIAKAQIDAQSKAQQAQMDEQLQKQMKAVDTQFQQWKLEREEAYKRWETEFDAAVKLQIESIKANAQSEMESARIGSQERMKVADMQREDAKEAKEAEDKAEDAQEKTDIAGLLGQIQEAVMQLQQSGQSRSIRGIQKVRDQAGRLIAGRITRADGSTEDIPIQ